MVAEIFVPQLVRSGAPLCTLCGGKTMNGLNCTCAVEAMWLYRATQGRIKTNACHVRDLTDDCVGGTNLKQMLAVSVSYGVTGGKLYQPIDNDVLFDLIDTGRYGAHYQISYAPVSGTAYDAFGGRFKGNHDIFLSGPGKAAGTIRVGDPGASGFRDWPRSLLRTGAGRLDLGGGVTINAEYGGDKCFSYVTPADPATSTTLYHVSFSGRTALYDSPGGKVVGSVTKASYTARRTKSGGLWWYQIIAPTSANNRRWFKPTRYTKITPI